MNPAPADRRWHASVVREAQRLARAQRERRGLIGQTLFLGTLGVVFVLPLVVAAYMGLWFDQHLPGYSTRGTLTGIVIGLAVGSIDVYLLLRERD